MYVFQSKSLLNTGSMLAMNQKMLISGGTSSTCLLLNMEVKRDINQMVTHASESLLLTESNVMKKSEKKSRRHFRVENR